MKRVYAAILLCAPLLLGGCELEDTGTQISSAETNRIMTHIRASLQLSILCSEAPLDPQDAARAEGYASVLLETGRAMADDVLTEGSPTVREELHSDASLYDTCMPSIAKRIRSALNEFPPPPQLYEETGRGPRSEYAA
jgi:hypothetical protein